MLTEQELVAKVTSVVKKKYDGDWKKAFKAVDVDSDGEISLNELGTFLVSVGLATHLSQWFIGKAVLQRFDLNNNSSISWAEFERVFNVMNAFPPQPGQNENVLFNNQNANATSDWVFLTAGQEISIFVQGSNDPNLTVNFYGDDGILAGGVTAINVYMTSEDVDGGRTSSIKVTDTGVHHFRWKPPPGYTRFCVSVSGYTAGAVNVGLYT